LEQGMKVSQKRTIEEFKKDFDGCRREMIHAVIEVLVDFSVDIKSTDS